MAKNRFPNYPKYTGRPAAPLSPHNSEIPDKAAQEDQEFLELRAAEKRKELNRENAKWLKSADNVARYREMNRPQDSSERRLAAILSGRVLARHQFEFCAEFDGEIRAFVSSISKTMVRIRSEATGSKIRIASRAIRGAVWNEIVIAKNAIMGSNGMVIESVVADAIERQALKNEK